MKKILLRILSVLCIVAVLFLTLYPNWIVQKGIKSKELKSIKTEIEDQINESKERLLDSKMLGQDAFAPKSAYGVNYIDSLLHSHNPNRIWLSALICARVAIG